MKGSIVTTSWDDGDILDLRMGELLLKYGMTGTFYISPRDRESTIEDRLTNEQLKKLSDNFEIGAHTMTHPHLTDLSDDEARKEIVESKEYLEKVIGTSVTSFCYPAGYFDARIARMVKEAGFALARTVERFTYTIGDPYSVPTTLHAYRHWSDAWPILKKVGLKKFFRCYLHWDDLAIELFDSMPDGGIFHLWGHSWEVEKNKDWARLERVLKHISLKGNVLYKTNGELV